MPQNLTIYQKEKAYSDTTNQATPTLRFDTTEFQKLQYFEDNALIAGFTSDNRIELYTSNFHFTGKEVASAEQIIAYGQDFLILIPKFRKYKEKVPNYHVDPLAPIDSKDSVIIDREELLYLTLNKYNFNTNKIHFLGNINPDDYYDFTLFASPNSNQVLGKDNLSNIRLKININPWETEVIEAERMLQNADNFFVCSSLSFEAAHTLWRVACSNEHDNTFLAAYDTLSLQPTGKKMDLNLRWNDPSTIFKINDSLLMIHEVGLIETDWDGNTFISQIDSDFNYNKDRLSITNKIYKIRNNQLVEIEANSDDFQFLHINALLLLNDTLLLNVKNLNNKAETIHYPLKFE